MIVLNALVVVSAVLVGGHYIIDVVAGAAVGAAAIYFAVKLQQPDKKPSVDAAL